MEFGYNEEQEKFRKELNDWLDENIPADIQFPAELEELDDETYAFASEFRRKLAAKGWLHPSYPKEYGGAALTYDQLVVYQEVFSSRTVPTVYDLGGLAAVGLLALGTEEQKNKWLTKITRGEIETWQCFTEPEAGTDLAGLSTRAIQQENGDFLMNGQKIYVGGGRMSDYLYVLAVTNPEAPRHQNISAFLVKADTPGITRDQLQPIMGANKNAIYFEDVHVPAECMLGELHKGWAFAQVSLAGERGMFVNLRVHTLARQILDYLKTAKRGDSRLVDDPHVRELVLDLYIESRIGKLWFERSNWKSAHKVPAFYEGPQNSLWNKTFGPKLAITMFNILGPLAHITDPEWVILKGKIEHQQRAGLMTHGGGTPEVQRLNMARALGLPGLRRR
ncbi:acyl-CoA dehydrogenase family protein [Chloroflexota bacterium]